MKKLLIKLRALMLLLLMMVGVSSVWAEEVVYKTALFGSSYNSKSVSSYTGSFSSTNDGFTVDVVNFNNNNNGWEYVKTGNKTNAAVGTITTNAAIDKAITKVVVTIDAITSSNVNSITLYSGTSADACTTSEGTFSKSTGSQTVSIKSPAANKFYKISFDCKKGSSNGLVQISKVEFYYDNSAGGDTPAPTEYTVTVTNDIANGTVSASPTSATEGTGITLTATPATGYEFGSWNVTNASTSTAITVTDNKFTMPAADVNVSATFNKSQTPSGPTVVTWVAKDQGYTNGEQYTSATIDSNISLAFGDGSNDGKYYDTGTGIRLYANGKMTVTAAEGYTMSKIVITYSASGNTGTFSANTDTYSLSSATGTWTGSANYVVLTNTATSGHARIQKVVVTYSANVVLTPGNITADDFSLNAVGDGNSKLLSTVFNDAAGTDRAMSYSIVSGTDVVSLDNGVLTAIKAGTASVKAEQAADDNYTATEKTITVTVNKVNPTFSIASQTLVEEDGTDVSFSTNSDGRTITFVSDNEDVATADDITSGETFPLYGWSAGETDITATLAATEKYNQKSVTFHVTVTSSSKEKYTVSFEMNGHGTQIDAKSGIISGSTILAPTDPSAEGYTFGGWYKEETCINAWNFSTDRVESNITLYAKWTINSYIVSFDLQGHGDAIEEMIVEHGEQIVAPTEPTATGYTFGGWYKEEACINAWNFSTDVVESDIVLYAKWSAEQLAITWMVNGNPAADGEQSISVAYGSKVSVLPETPADLGNNKFMGWTAIENYSHESDAPSDLFTTVDGSPNITAATTFYAVYAIVTSGDPRSEEMTNSEIASLSSSANLAYATAVGYKDTNIDYEFKAYTDNSRNWVQLKKDQGAYVKIVAPGNITKVVVCITSNTNDKGGIDDISKHNAYSGYVGLVTEDCSFTSTSENIGITNNITDNMASIESDGSSKEVFLKVTTGARIWSIETYYNDADICSNYTTSVKNKQTPMLSFDAPEVNKTTADEDFVCVATLNVDGLGISYSSSNSLVATVDTNTGRVHIVGKGTTTIKATSKETEDYFSSTAQFTLNVAKGISDGEFDFTDKDQDYGSGVTPTNNGSSYIEESKTWVAGNVTLVTNGKYRKWISNNGIDLRCYADEETSLSFSVPSGYYITSIDFGTSVVKFETEVGELVNNNWNGYANRVEFKWKAGQSGNVNFEFITVTYGKYLPLAVSSARWATFAPSENVELPSEVYGVDPSVRVYHVSTNPDDKGMIDFAKTNETITEGKTIAARTGILVKAEAGTYYFPVNTTVEPTELTGNQLVGVLSSTAKPGDNAFIFKNGSKGIGFYPWSTGDLAAGKCYLQLTPAQAAGEVRFIGLPEDDELSTSIELVFDENGTEDSYNLFGQKVDTRNYKGIIVKGGVKSVVK